MKIGVWAAFVAALFATDARARGACQEREKIKERLQRDYNEVQVSHGVTYAGTLLEVYASPEGSFTIIISYGGGLSCPVSAGNGWQQIKPIAGGEKS